MAKSRILIVDDEPLFRSNVREFLNLKGFEVIEADCCQVAEEVFQTAQPDAAIVDYVLPDGNALDLIPRLKAIEPNVPLIVLTGYGTIDLAVKAMKDGAEHFLTKPISLGVLLVIITRMLETQRQRRNEMAGQVLRARHEIDPFVGTSPAIRQLEEQARRVLNSESTLLLYGETGVGKGVMARWLHQNSPRAQEAFVDMNCAGLSKDLLESELFGHKKGSFTGAIENKTGLLEVAHQGTVFLDEIGDMDQQVQPKLLKVLEEKQFRRLGEARDRMINIRLIAASHPDLAQLVRDKRFRSDLYYRISTIPLLIPPLRERTEDVPHLALKMAERIGFEMGRHEITFEPDALRALQTYSWPGNIRELKNVLERTLLLSGKTTLSRRDFQFDLMATPEAAPVPTQMTLEELERVHIERVLHEENDQVGRAAERLGISRSSLYQKINRYNLKVSKQP